MREGSGVNCMTLPRSLKAAAVLLILLGCGLRLFHIERPDFIFYDEGLYLNHNRLIGRLWETHPPRTLSETRAAAYAYLTHSLASGKGLWFLLADTRIFFGGLRHWAYPRVLAALFGILTIPLTGWFARRYYGSRRVGWAAAVCLALLPGHVFYSRLGMQESLSAFLTLAAFHLYLFPRRFGWRAFFSGILAAAAFFSNYRLIILPGLFLVAEGWLALSDRRRPDLRKWIWQTVTFTAGVVLVGDIHDGQNTVIIFSWIFHQASMAAERLAWINLATYPYILVRLEGVLFVSAWLGNLAFVLRKRWDRLLPFVLALTVMGVFTFAGEKAARYLCVVHPFLAMAAAAVVVHGLERIRREVPRFYLILGVVLALGGMISRSSALAAAGTDYARAVRDLATRGEDVRVVATQPLVVDLFVEDPDRVAECPHRFDRLLALYAQGFRYLLVGPQAYVSWTESGRRFDPPLEGYLQFILDRVPPLREYPHLEGPLLERFVLEHSEHLGRTHAFLSREGGKKYGRLRLYDLRRCVPLMAREAARLRVRGTAGDGR